MINKTFTILILSFKICDIGFSVLFLTREAKKQEASYLKQDLRDRGGIQICVEQLINFEEKKRQKQSEVRYRNPRK